jgi:hypothetical protein
MQRPTWILAFGSATESRDSAGVPTQDLGGRLAADFGADGSYSSAATSRSRRRPSADDEASGSRRSPVAACHAHPRQRLLRPEAYF